MRKEEFLASLRSHLNGRLSPSEVEEHIRYYENYIETKCRQGESEEQVLQMLGDPRLIARSILDAGKGQNPAHSGGGEYRGSDYNTYENQNMQIHQVPGWLVLVIFICIAIVVLSFCFFLLRLLFPIIALFVIGGFVYILFKRSGFF